MTNLRLEEKNKKFFNKWASRYDKGFFKKWRRKLIEKIIEIAKINKNSKILDAGCGTGELLKLLISQKKNLKLYGIDVSDKMLEVAEKKLKNKAKLKMSSVENINFKDNYFDYVFSEDAFHHYADYDLVMKNFYRILKIRGKLVVVDVDFGFIGNKIFHWLEPGNNKMHSKKEFIELFKKYGFKKIKQKKISLIHILTIGEKWDQN